MAHELHFTDGRADFFEVGPRRSAWHPEGALFTTAPSLADALGAARLDYEVEKVRTYISGETATHPACVVSRRANVTVRRDTGAELGVVGPNYRPLQNRDALHAIEPLIGEGVLTLETGGVVRGGADAWLLARFDLARFDPICREVFADEVVPYALITNNHDGRRHAGVALTPIRVVCANTLAAAEPAMDRDGQTIGVRHTADVAARVANAAETLLASVARRYETLAQQYRRLQDTTLDPAHFRSLVLDIAIRDQRRAQDWDPDARLAQAVIDRYERRAATITRLWTEGAGHTGEPTAWFALNAVAQAFDHDRELWPSRGTGARAALLLDGTLAATKRAFLTLLLWYSRN